MANQSIISLPPDIEDPVVLKRFLARLVEQLDIVFGNKAGPTKQYTDQKELETALELVNKLIKKEASALTNRVAKVEEKNSQQDTRLDDIELLDSQQDTRLDNIELLDSQQDTRLDNIEAAGYITDAPSDGSSYARKDGAWVIIP